MKVQILGTRGIPAQHGGFETFAEKLALYLVSERWKVRVYCQGEPGTQNQVRIWNNIELVNVPVSQKGALGTLVFDLKSTLLALKDGGLVLILGYNTAIFTLLYRLKKIPSIMNMDGLEWKRAKWSWLHKVWLYLNERAGCLLANHLIADHPLIAEHLKTRVSANKITMIPYGADIPRRPSRGVLREFGLKPRKYVLLIARPEPENSILEIVSSFSEKERGIQLVVLGAYDPTKSYPKLVMKKASDEVRFLGAIYDKKRIGSLRHYAALYIHGHQVGGTNPSLVEALAAGNPVLAHDNIFNHWVIGEKQKFFKNTNDCNEKLSFLLKNKKTLNEMSHNSFEKYKFHFQWDDILESYKEVLEKWK